MASENQWERDIRERVAALLKGRKNAARLAAKELGLSVRTVLALASGARVHPGSLMVAERGLAALARKTSRVSPEERGSSAVVLETVSAIPLLVAPSESQRAQLAGAHDVPQETSLRVEAFDPRGGVPADALKAVG
jgi:hypothetical protein